MKTRCTLCAALVSAAAVLSVATDASAAIINTARRTVKLAASVKIATNTKGQRQILITIDPGVTTAFNIDVAYPSNLVQPDSDDGSGTLLPSTAIAYAAPYGAAGTGATIARGAVVGMGVVNNVQGQYNFGGPPGAPVANRADGNSDLFTLAFDDRAPDKDKTFTILGLGSANLDPGYAGLIADNYLDAYIDDPNDPLFGQTLHFTGDQIESLTFTVPADVRGGGPTVPLPAALMTGALGAVMVGMTRHFKRNR